MQAYDDFLNERLPEVEYEDSRLQEGLKSVVMEAPAG
jgi:hypothetical protein